MDDLEALHQFASSACLSESEAIVDHDLGTVGYIVCGLWKVLPGSMSDISTTVFLSPHAGNSIMLIRHIVAVDR